ncbi:MAG: c-type cytochrome domain-containing protein [Gemmataceae bacterium]
MIQKLACFAVATCLFFALLPWGQAQPEPAAAPAPISFEKDVLPILEAKCVSCHGDGKNRKAGLDVRTPAAILKGGKSGPSLNVVNRKRSLLWISVATDDMPPGKDKFTPEEKQLLRRWVHEVDVSQLARPAE